MAVKKGVVLEVEGPEAIVLTAGGEFERIPVGRRSLDVGMEITLPSRRKSLLPFGKAWTNWVAGAAAVLMLMAIVPLLSQVRQSGEVVAYVDIDINPSLQLAVNEDERVVAAEPLNNDGRRVLSEVRVVGQKMEEAVAQITEQAIEDGYISKDHKNSVVVALTPAHGRRVALTWENRLRDSINSTLQTKHQAASVDTRVASTELRLTARRQGLSVGGLMMFLAAKEENLDITVDEIKKNPINEVIRGKGVNPEELVKKEHQPKDWENMVAKFDPELSESKGGTATKVVSREPAAADQKIPDTQGNQTMTVAVQEGQDKADVKPGINGADDLSKDPAGPVKLSEMGRSSKKPKKPQEDGKPAESGQGTPAAGQNNPPAGQSNTTAVGDKKPDEPASTVKPSQPATDPKTEETGSGAKPTDGQAPAAGNVETHNSVNNPAAQVPVETTAPEAKNIQAPANP